MVTVYVKLWRIDGQKQTHIKGKSFKIEDEDDVVFLLEWVEDTIRETLEKEVEER